MEESHVIDTSILVWKVVLADVSQYFLQQHRIFHGHHGFKNPPRDLKVVMDSSFSLAAVEHGANPVTCLTDLEHVGDVTFFATKCIIDDIVNKVGAEGVPPNVQIKTNEKGETYFVAKNVTSPTCSRSVRQVTGFASCSTAANEKEESITTLGSRGGFLNP
ncbi:hypothetical protein Tco_0405695 [Tanacetum coccineum]